MPLYDFSCPEGHTLERYFHTAEQARTELVVCECGAPMLKQLSMGRGLTYFEEGRASIIENLGPEPVRVTSHEQHKRLMREAGVTWATAGKGRRGCWV